MFKSVYLKNYKTFREIAIDFSRNKKENSTKKIISIYGENGSGKSNIADLFAILTRSVSTLDTLDRYTKIRNKIAHGQAYSDSVQEDMEIYHTFYSQENYSLKDVIVNCKTKYSEDENMTIKYEFILNGFAGDYAVVFNDNDDLIKEVLNYGIGQRKGRFFSIEYTKDGIQERLSPSVFKSKSFNKDLKEQIDKLWGTHSFLAIIKNYAARINADFLKKNVSDRFFEVIDYFSHLSISTNDFVQICPPKGLLSDLDKGSINKNEESKIAASQKLLFTLLTSLYSDIKDVVYSVSERENKLSYELMIYKEIGGKITKLPFELESKGTKKILNLLPLILNGVDGQTVVIDEIDNGVHDLLMSSLIESLSDSIEGQMIFTTHDTYLMQVLPKNSMYIIHSDQEGNRRLECLDNYKISANNNISKMYLSGAFSGIPYPMSLDFEYMLEELKE